MKEIFHICILSLMLKAGIFSLEACRQTREWQSGLELSQLIRTHYHMHIARAIWKFGGTSHRVMQIIFGLVQSASSPNACVFAYAASEWKMMILKLPSIIHTLSCQVGIS